MAIVPVSEVPTVSLLYHLKKLQPTEVQPGSTEVTPEPSKSFNDRIGIFNGDITKLEIDAIVNAANRSLLGGGGVDGAIHRAAGPELYDECCELDGCETGSAKITDAYRLPSRKVIHAVGPVYDDDETDECEALLRGCYKTSLRLAVENDCKSIAFSCLSTGIYGYPSDEAALVALEAVREFFQGEDGDKIERVIFCTFVQKDVRAYNFWIPQIFPPIAESTAAEGEDEWEEVEEGESAENGAAEEKSTEDVVDKIEETEVISKDDLPEVPKTEPVTEGPLPKKQKPSVEDGEKTS